MTLMRDPLRVLILEDEPSLSMILEHVVHETAPSIVIVRASLAAASEVIDRPFDLAFLDVNLTNGETYDIAKSLKNRNIDFTFVSGTPPEDFPHELRKAAFIPKPFHAHQIQSVVLSAQRKKDGRSIPN
jgi:DNA-binding response OmpR family regulator